MSRAVSPRYDAIVAGVGGMGSAAVYHLARRGRRVLGLERFDVPNDMGSSLGVTGIIRQAYYEHPSYDAPLQIRQEPVGGQRRSIRGEVAGLAADE